MKRINYSLILALSLIATASASNVEAATAKGTKVKKTNAVKKVRAKATKKNQLRVQAVPMVWSKKAGYSLPHYYNQASEKSAVGARLEKIQARLGFKILKSLEYMPGISISRDVQLQINGFTHSGFRTAPVGQRIIEGGVKTTYAPQLLNVRGQKIADMTHETSAERDMVFSIMQRGLALGDVRLFVNSADLSTHHHASVPMGNAFVEFSGKKRQLTEWIPKPVKVSDIVKSIRAKKNPGIVSRIGGKKIPSDAKVVEQVAKELRLE